MKRVVLVCLAIASANLDGRGAERTRDKKNGAAARRDLALVDGSEEPGLVGYWKLRGDCRDYSGHGNHGVNHGVNLDRGAFDGISAYIEIPSNASLQLGTSDFSLCAWIYTEKELDDVVGDVLEMATLLSAGHHSFRPFER
jgi:hypothetical protein